MKKLITILIVLFTMTASGQETLDALLRSLNSNSIPYITVEELDKLRKKEPVHILDSREQQEFDVSHINTATCVGYSNFDLDAVEKKIKDKNAPIVVYCSLGVRSEKIGEKLKNAGYTNVKNLYGGIFTWKNEGYDVVDKDSRTTQKVHAYSKKWSKWLTAGTKVYE